MLVSNTSTSTVESAHMAGLGGKGRAAAVFVERLVETRGCAVKKVNSFSMYKWLMLRSTSKAVQSFVLGNKHLDEECVRGSAANWRRSTVCRRSSEARLTCVTFLPFCFFLSTVKC